MKTNILKICSSVALKVVHNTRSAALKILTASGSGYVFLKGENNDQY
jgi:hypothetical protein